MFLGELPLAFGQVGLAHRDDEAPVLADRAVLHLATTRSTDLSFTPGIHSVVKTWPWRHRTTTLPPSL
jgi:hypothetical protein